ncbi:Fe-S cluster protein [Marinitoga sp. 1197]|uniref:permease n=1 Tax=unclassified Marinitoga TaxID=2640159 RepID=UPI0006414A04|nr:MULTISPECIES: permease [unclassified Marinitoga]KLO21546.1 Fe-S cluster protein [Marinitoga sp. 1197]KLO23274.1 Fe-S cluster protein [Marinitoga sp. 1155]NUV00408.1 Fe-S cluster protein [Marinitoga sp. 1154]
MKKIISLIKNNKLIFISIILYTIAFFVKPEIFFKGLEMTKGFLIEMIEVMPPILIISSLITVWVPSEVIMKHFGKESGIKGKFLSIFTGAISAGPIYAAFPVAQALFLKGASIANLVIIISSWAVVKVVMFMVESSFLGLSFALTRYALTIPAILIMGYVMEKLVKREDILEEIENTEIIYNTPKEVLNDLPNMNCGACGYANCKLFAEGVIRGEVSIDDCVIRAKARKTA